MKVRLSWLVGIVAVAALAGLSAAERSRPQTAKLDKVALQLKWVTQAQFAGYYAAKAKGYYEDAGLDVTIKPGGPDITPEVVVASGQAEFGIDWLPSLLSQRDRGGTIVNIAQVFTRSGVTELTWKDTGIDSIAHLRGKRVGVWLGGSEFEQYAALQKNGIDPKKKSDVAIVAQPFDMNLFLQRQIDAASAMTYNELAQVLEQKNPKTGKLHSVNELNVFKMEDAGTGMLEDGVFTRGDWIKDTKNQDIAKRLLAASFKGWIYCRDHQADCVNTVLANGPTLGRGHQTWQMNEIDALIWPAPKGIGVMDPASFTRTVGIALKFGIIKRQASDAYRSDLASAAVADLERQGVDVNGLNWHKAVVQVTPGGK